MPRAPFNTTATFVQGPGQPSPGAVRFSGPARFVAADGISQVGLGSPVIAGWITTESGVPIGSWVPGIFGLDSSLADQVAVGSGPTKYWVLWTELVDWKGSYYYRASVAELPIPESCDCSPVVPDGLTCETAATMPGGDPFGAGFHAYPVPPGESRWFLIDGGPTGGDAESDYVGEISYYTTGCELVTGPFDPSVPISSGLGKIKIHNYTGIASDGFTVHWI